MASSDGGGQQAELRQVSQAAGLAIAAAALCGGKFSACEQLPVQALGPCMTESCAAGALVAGATHFMSTAKKLTEEGVDPAARVRAMPLAVCAAFSACMHAGACAACAQKVCLTIHRMTCRSKHYSSARLSRQRQGLQCSWAPALLGWTRTAWQPSPPGRQPSWSRSSSG